MPHLRIATRSSALARWQAERVAQRLAGLGATTELVFVETTGDLRRDVPIHAVGGTGVFVKEVQTAVLEGRADLAVHSAKDLPSAPADGLTIVAVPERADVRDALVGRALDDIPEGGTIATGSVRRRVLLAELRPDVVFAELRGNIDTRLAKAEGFDAVVVAVAALHRLGHTAAIAQTLDPTVVVPQVAQGALAIECRVDDPETRDAVVQLDDPTAHRAVAGERAFLAGIGGGCDLPLGAHATIAPDGTVTLRAVLADDGGRVHRVLLSGHDAHDLGARAATRLLSEVQP